MNVKVDYPDLATYLAESGVTQVEVAVAVGTTQGTISRIATGEMMPRPQLATRLARFCKIPIESFARVYLARRRSA